MKIEPIHCPETSVSTTLRRVTSQKNADLICAATDTWIQVLGCSLWRYEVGRIILEFMLAPCCEGCVLSFVWFRGVWILCTACVKLDYFNPLMSNDPYTGRTAPLNSKRCILYIYSTNIVTEYFKHGIYSPFFFLSSKCNLFHNSNEFGSCIIHILYTGCQNFKKIRPNDPYTGRTAPLNSKRCILYIYSTNIRTEYFKHGIYSPIFSLQNAVCFIIITYLVPVLFTFYIQGVLKLKK